MRIADPPPEKLRAETTLSPGGDVHFFDAEGDAGMQQVTERHIMTFQASRAGGIL